MTPGGERSAWTPRQHMLGARGAALEIPDLTRFVEGGPVDGTTDRLMIAFLTRWIRELEAELGEERVRALVAKDSDG